MSQYCNTNRSTAKGLVFIKEHKMYNKLKLATNDSNLNLMGAKLFEIFGQKTNKNCQDGNINI